MEVKIVKDVSDAEDYSLHISHLIIQTRVTEREVVLTEITAKPRPAATLFQEKLEKIWLLLMESMLGRFDGEYKACEMVERHNTHE